jgi:hypothetical protein
MRIEIELPDWVDERHIYIMAGVELAAYKEAQETTWHVKTKRCVQCGRCCLNLPKGQYILDENGDCINLIFDGKDKRLCKLGAMRPLPCCEGDPVKGNWGKDFCSIRYDNEE